MSITIRYRFNKTFKTDKKSMEQNIEQRLRQLFKNRSNCYVDSDDVIQAMDEDCFIEVLKEIFPEKEKTEPTPITDKVISDIVKYDNYLFEMKENNPTMACKTFKQMFGYEINLSDD